MPMYSPDMQDKFMQSLRAGHSGIANKRELTAFSIIQKMRLDCQSQRRGKKY